MLEFFLQYFNLTFDLPMKLLLLLILNFLILNNLFGNDFEDKPNDRFAINSFRIEKDRWGHSELIVSIKCPWGMGDYCLGRGSSATEISVVQEFLKDPELPCKRYLCGAFSLTPLKYCKENMIPLQIRNLLLELNGLTHNSIDIIKDNRIVYKRAVVFFNS